MNNMSYGKGRNLSVIWEFSKKCSTALMGKKDAIVCRLKRTLSSAYGYHDPPSMNIRGNFPLQACFAFLRKTIASFPHEIAESLFSRY